MGISGLLPVLKSITNGVHIREYAGKKVAVDGYSWLHKGAFGCAFELAQGKSTDKFVRYCMSRVNLLRDHGVIPIIIFDGDTLPQKVEEEAARQRMRRENRAKGEAHLKAGNSVEAFRCFQRSIDVTPAMAKQFIEALKMCGVEYLVAPYEADAQMAYLALNEKIHAVITEDSDLLAYGCPRVLFKLDKTGHGQEIQVGNLGSNRDMSFVGFNHQMFLEMCILAGCDFLTPLHGIATKKAYQLIKRLKSFTRVCRYLKLSGDTTVPDGFERDFQKAIWVFRHQRVFCAERKMLVHVNPLPDGGLDAADVSELSAIPTGEELKELRFLGPNIAPNEALTIAKGDLDPISRMPFNSPGRGNSQKSAEGKTEIETRVQKMSAVNRRSGTRGSGSRWRVSVQSNRISNYFPTIPPAPQEVRRQFVAPRASRKNKENTGIQVPPKQEANNGASKENDQRQAPGDLGKRKRDPQGVSSFACKVSAGEECSIFDGPSDGTLDPSLMFERKTDCMEEGIDLGMEDISNVTIRGLQDEHKLPVVSKRFASPISGSLFDGIETSEDVLYEELCLNGTPDPSSGQAFTDSDELKTDMTPLSLLCGKLEQNLENKDTDLEHSQQGVQQEEVKECASQKESVQCDFEGTETLGRFHSVRHIPTFANVARNALDSLESRLGPGGRVGKAKKTDAQEGHIGCQESTLDPCLFGKFAFTKRKR